jgi:hypothetical protein
MPKKKELPLVEGLEATLGSLEEQLKAEDFDISIVSSVFKGYWALATEKNKSINAVASSRGTKVPSIACSLSINDDIMTEWEWVDTVVGRLMKDAGCKSTTIAVNLCEDGHDDYSHQLWDVEIIGFPYDIIGTYRFETREWTWGESVLELIKLMLNAKGYTLVDECELESDEA